MSANVLSRLKEHRRRIAPFRPGIIPPDKVLFGLYQRKLADMKLRPDEEEAVAAFVAWRSGVFAIEEANAATVGILLSAIRFAELKAGAVTEETAAARVHIQREWGMFPPLRITDETIRNWSQAIASEHGLLTPAARRGEAAA